MLTNERLNEIACAAFERHNGRPHPWEGAQDWVLTAMRDAVTAAAINQSLTTEHPVSGADELSAWRERFKQYEYRPQDDCVALKMAPQPSGNAHHLADDTRVGILADSSYINGLRTGYVLGQAGNESEYQKIVGATRAQIREARADIEDQPFGNAGELPQSYRNSGQIEEREAFEKSQSQFFDMTRSSFRSTDYAAPSTHNAWEGWQARAALADQASGQDWEDAERYRWLRNRASAEGICVVHIDYWSDEYRGQAHCEVYDGEFLDKAIDHARRIEDKT